jgi:ankyrin repeat protein
LILENVKNKNPGDNDGDTPLLQAAECGHLEICKSIIESVQNRSSGIQFVAVNTKIWKLSIENPMNNAGFTPLDLAEDSGKTNVYEYINSIVKKGNPARKH